MECMSEYIWQLDSWPHMTWDDSRLILPLGKTRLVQGELQAKAEHLGIELQAEQLEEEVFSTAAIEGERLERAQIRSSVERRLGLKTAGITIPDKRIDGLVQVLIDATRNHSDELSAERLKSWQSTLFPSGYSGLHRIITGDWRKGTAPMQVVPGTPGKETVHYEAPPADRLEKEMSAYLSWFNSPAEDVDGIIRAAHAHLYFVTIHPFEDGNGRLARAVADMVLARDDGRERRLYSMSAAILSERAEYYDVLERTQRGNGDITEWLVWFLECMEKALQVSIVQVNYAGEKAHLWQSLAEISLNPRQKKVVNQLSESGRDGFEGRMTNSKYRRMTGTSRETAKRDLSDLLSKGVIRRNPGGGRSTSYSLMWPDNHP